MLQNPFRAVPTSMMSIGDHCLDADRPVDWALPGDGGIVGRGWMNHHRVCLCQAGDALVFVR